MRDYPWNQLEFEARLAAEELCREYLAQLHWLESSQCPQRRHGTGWPVRERCCCNVRRAPVDIRE